MGPMLRAYPNSARRGIEREAARATRISMPSANSTACEMLEKIPIHSPSETIG